MENATVEPSTGGANRVDTIETAQTKRVAALWLDFALADWQAIKIAAADYAKEIPALGGDGSMSYRTVGLPMLALATAKTGDVPSAEAAISTTPLDCYFCVRARGLIAALGKNWSQSARWFAAATKLAPSLPAAWSEWGEMALAHGDTEDAISKFAVAHQKGPRFADPLELWGEALMLETRSDLALDKFEEANTYAPRWGRLHLHWGEALFYLDRKDEARAQFQAASGMDLSTADRAALVRDQGKLHG